MTDDLDRDLCEQLTFPLTLSRDRVENVLENKISLSASIAAWWGSTSLLMKNHCTYGVTNRSSGGGGCGPIHLELHRRVR